MLNTNLSPEIRRGECMLFEETSPFIEIGENGQHGLVVVKRIIPTLFEAQLSQAQANGVNPDQCLTPVAADLYSRKMVDLSDIEVPEQSRSEELKRLKDLERRFGSAKGATEMMVSLAHTAFIGVLFRPRQLEVPRQNGPVHASELDLCRDDAMHIELFRHRLNIFRKLSNRAQLGEKKLSRIEHLFDFHNDGNVHLNFDRTREFFNDDSQPKQVQMIESFQTLFIGTFAAKLEPLLSADQEEAEVLRRQFIERGYEELDRLDISRNVGETFFHVPINDTAKRHILAGDVRGGGHYLPALDENFFQAVGSVEKVHGGMRGSSQQVDASLVHQYDKAGNLIDRRVSAFFPSEWTEAEVIDAICNPSRLIFEREEDGVIKQYVESRGIMVVRILYLSYGDEEDELITAFPAAHIPQDVQKRLLA